MKVTILYLIFAYAVFGLVFYGCASHAFRSLVNALSMALTGSYLIY